MSRTSSWCTRTGRFTWSTSSQPASRLADPQIAEALSRPGRLFQADGWEHEIWTGADPVLLANLRFLAGYWRPGVLPEGLLNEVLAAVRPGDTIGGWR
jgi:hypothetical protein